MAKKRAVIGFKNINLAEVTTDTSAAYVSGDAVAIPYAGTMTRTPKETSQSIYYDDELYAETYDVTGEDAEIRIGEADFAVLAPLGWGTYDAETRKFEGNFSARGKSFAVRCEADTVDAVPYYFNYRVFELKAIRFDNLRSKGSDVQVAEVVITGTFKKPKLATLKPYAIMSLADDGSNQAACTAFLEDGETFPVVTP